MKRGINKKILVLFAFSLMIVITVYSLEAYKSYHCTTLCISNLSQEGDYKIGFQVSYAGHKLPSAGLTATINNIYRAEVKTNPMSRLEFKAPLKFGINTVTIAYGASKATASFIYLDGMLYMFLIPLGAILLLIVKASSLDIGFANKVVFHSDIEIGDTRTDSFLTTAIEMAAKGDKRIIKGLPELTSEVSIIAAKLARREGQIMAIKDSSYLCQKIEKEHIASARSGCISQLPLTREAIASRGLYQQSVLFGSAILTRTKSHKAFLEANEVTFKDSLSKTVLSKSKWKGKTRLFLFSLDEVSEVSDLARSYSKTGSTLLLMLTGRTLKITILGD